MNWRASVPPPSAPGKSTDWNDILASDVKIKWKSSLIEVHVKGEKVAWQSGTEIQYQGTVANEIRSKVRESVKVWKEKRGM